MSQNHELSVVGGSENTSINFSLGYLNEQGLMNNDNLNRFNVKLGVDHKINKFMDVGGNALLTKRNWNRREDKVWSQVIKMHSIADINLDIPSDLANSHTNPLINQKDGYYENLTQSNRFFGNTYLNIEPIKGLVLKTILSTDLNNKFVGIYEDYQITSRNQSGKDSYMSQENTNEYKITWDNLATYDKEFKGGHDLKVLLGNSTEIKESLNGITSGTAGKVHYFTNSFNNLGNITAVEEISNEYIGERMLSYFGRVNYIFKGKYAVQGTLRADGSSVLSEGNKWGYFPSVSGFWRIKDEKFLKDVKAISNLKMRLSWGEAGNASVDPYQTLTILTNGFRNNYSFMDVSTFGYVPGNLGNKDLSWERTQTYDVGIDFGLFKDRISGSVDLYYSKTNDLILPKLLPLTSGYVFTLDNVGATQNKGIEVVLNTVNVKTKDFTWSSDWTFSLNRDEILSLSSGLSQDITDVNQALVVGEPVKCFLDYEIDGVWGTADSAQAAIYGQHPGQLKIKDQNNDSTINADDRILYNQSPNFIFGWNNHFRYKNFSLSIMTFGRFGQWIDYDLYDAFNPTVADGTPYLNYWTPENQDARFPRPGEANTAEYSALNKVKASYWKIKDITLSYNLPKKMLSKVGISNVRVYGSMKNFFTFSNIDNYDPEQGGSISNPLMKQVVFGLNLQF